MKHEQIKKFITTVVESVCDLCETDSNQISAEEEKLRDKVLEDGRIDDYIFDVLDVSPDDRKTVSEKQTEYADYVVKLVLKDGLDFDEAIEHVVSKDWEAYREEIIDKALEDDFSTAEAEKIADAVASPCSGITYPEYVSGMRR